MVAGNPQDGRSRSDQARRPGDRLLPIVLRIPLYARPYVAFHAGSLLACHLRQLYGYALWPPEPVPTRVAQGGATRRRQEAVFLLNLF